ncbi:MAG: hypothetical protein WAX12_04085 [Candidatus Microthrix subdominans]
MLTSMGGARRPGGGQDRVPAHFSSSLPARLPRASRPSPKDPAILRLAYDRAEALRPGLPPVRWTYDTTEVGGE